jgi:hypothetical protein
MANLMIILQAGGPIWPTLKVLREQGVAFIDFWRSVGDTPSKVVSSRSLIAQSFANRESMGVIYLRERDEALMRLLLTGVQIEVIPRRVKKR